MTKNRGDKRFTSCCLPVIIKSGVGSFHFPNHLRHDIQDTYCIVHAIHGFNTVTPSKCLFVFCDVSYYYDREQVPRYNVLQVFQSNTNLKHFKKISNRLSIVPDCIKLRVKEYKDEQFEICSAWNGLIVLEIFGYHQ